MARASPHGAVLVERDMVRYQRQRSELLTRLERAGSHPEEGIDESQCRESQPCIQTDPAGESSQRPKALLDHAALDEDHRADDQRQRHADRGGVTHSSGT